MGETGWLTHLLLLLLDHTNTTVIAASRHEKVKHR